MARAKDQARWRQRSDRRRVEVYLPAEIAERLDALAAERGESRAAVIAALVGGVGGETAAQERESEPQEAAQPPRTAKNDVPPPQAQEVPKQIKWRRVGRMGYDALDEHGEWIAYVRREEGGWQAEHIGRGRSGQGHGRTRAEAVADLYRR